MGILNFLFGETRDALKLPAASDDFWYQPVSADGYGSYISPEVAMSLTAVYTSTRITAESVATLPLHLYKRLDAEGAKQREADHPLSDLFRRPNVWMTPTDFWEWIVSWVCMRGNAFALKAMSNGGKILQLIPLDPQRMEIEQLSTGELRYHFRTKKGVKVIYDQEQMFHVRGLPFNGIQGISPLQSLQRVIGYQMETLRYGSSFFKNNAQPGGIVMHPMKMGEEAQKNLKESIQKSYSGDNVGKVMLLEEGVKFESAKVSHHDLQFIEIQKINKRDIYAAYRIPPHLAGDLERATFSNIEHQSLEFVTYTLTPWLKRIEEAIWRDLISEKDKKKYYAEFLVNGFLRGAVEQRYNAYVKGLNNGFLNADEVRSYENLNPIPDGSGKIFRVPLNLTTSDAEPEPEAQEPGGTPSTPGAAQPVEGRSKLNTLFYPIFEEQYGRLLVREEKTTKKDATWESDHKAFVSKQLSALLVTYSDLWCSNETERLKSETFRRKIGTFAAESDSLLRQSETLHSAVCNEPASDLRRSKRIASLWDTIQKELNTAIGE